MLDHESIKLGLVLIGGFGCLAIVLAPEINELIDKIKQISKQGLIMFTWLKTKYYQWKFRFIDEDICCCGGKITGTWCGAPHPCRSAKEYAITKAVEGNDKFKKLTQK